MPRTPPASWRNPPLGIPSPMTSLSCQRRRAQESESECLTGNYSVRHHHPCRTCCGMGTGGKRRSSRAQKLRPDGVRSTASYLRPFASDNCCELRAENGRMRVAAVGHSALHIVHHSRTLRSRLPWQTAVPPASRRQLPCRRPTFWTPSHKKADAWDRGRAPHLHSPSRGRSRSPCASPSAPRKMQWPGKGTFDRVVLVWRGRIPAKMAWPHPRAHLC